MGSDAHPQATWTEELFEEAERRMHEAVAALIAIPPVLRRLADDTDWHAASACLFHISAEELLGAAVRAADDAGEAADTVRAERARRIMAGTSLP